MDRDDLVDRDNLDFHHFLGVLVDLWHRSFRVDRGILVVLPVLDNLSRQLQHLDHCLLWDPDYRDSQVGQGNQHCPADLGSLGCHFDLVGQDILCCPGFRELRLDPADLFDRVERKQLEQVLICIEKYQLDRTRLSDRRYHCHRLCRLNRAGREDRMGKDCYHCTSNCPIA